MVYHLTTILTCNKCPQLFFPFSHVFNHQNLAKNCSPFSMVPLHNRYSSMEIQKLKDALRALKKNTKLLKNFGFASIFYTFLKKKKIHCFWNPIKVTYQIKIKINLIKVKWIAFAICAQSTFNHFNSFTSPHQWIYKISVSTLPFFFFLYFFEIRLKIKWIAYASLGQNTNNHYDSPPSPHQWIY